MCKITRLLTCFAFTLNESESIGVVGDKLMLVCWDRFVMKSQFLSGLFGWCIATLFAAAIFLGDGENSVFHQSRVERVKDQYIAMAEARIEAMRVNQVVQDVARIEASNIVAIAATTEAPAPEPAIPQIEVETAIVTGSTVNLREGPSTNYSRVGAVSEGDELVLTGVTDGNWVEIQHPTNGGKAWMHGNYIELQ